MTTIIFGLFIGVGVLFYSLLGVSTNSKLYLDVYSFVLVLGGTISASLLSITWKNLRGIYSTIKDTFITKSFVESDVIEELIVISEKACNAKKLSTIVHESQNPFIRKGLRLLQSEVEPQDMRKILFASMQSDRDKAAEHSDILKSMAKYPPSFGMIGTILGLIGMLEDMSISSGLEKIGVKMALALVTTLYGLLLANYVLVPLSEIIVNKAQGDLKLKKTILDTFILMATNKNDPVLVKEFLGVDNQVKESMVKAA